MAAPESQGRPYIMKMKYFRFLYGEMKSCMIHFAGVNDTISKQMFSMLFIRGSETKEERKNIPFLFPDSLDLAVLGNINESVKMVWNELQQHVKVRTLIVPDIPDAEDLHLEEVEEVIRLRPADWSDGSLEKIPDDSQWKTVTAGWHFQVICWMNGGLAVWHDTADNFADHLYAGKEEIGKVTDCVMSVKAVEDSICCEKQNPDHYGCALGCALHRDYDVCKFRYEKRANPYLTGTLLTAGNGEMDMQDKFLHWLSEQTDSIRFFSVQNPESLTGILQKSNIPESGMRRYVIELNDECNNHIAASLCRTGFCTAPVLLKEGQGVCCSGFLKF